jgi:hypothetical protein
MESCIDLEVAANGDDIKLMWRAQKRWRQTWTVKAATLRKQSKKLRAILDRLNACVVRNPGLDPEKDPEGTYVRVLADLRVAGRGLFLALFNNANAGSIEAWVAAQLKQLPPATQFTVYCGDSDVSLPWGFVFAEPIGAVPKGQPSLKDFDGFWLSRFRITVLIDGSGCDRDNWEIDPQAFKVLYALNTDELRDASVFLGDLKEKLEQLLRLDVGMYADWDGAQEAWDDIAANDNVIFVFAHSEGETLSLADSTRDTLTLRDMFRKPATSPATLLVLNCCSSAVGAEGISLLSTVAQRGFCGLIGTEAEIGNVHALRCGAQLMWELCAEGLALGEAFEAMRADPALFPLNLFYTCYAEREFRLRKPLAALNKAA